MAIRLVYQRPDKKWAWNLTADNGRIVATDGSQGYDNEEDAREMANRIMDGEFKDAKRVRRPHKE